MKFLELLGLLRKLIKSSFQYVKASTKFHIMKLFFYGDDIDCSHNWELYVKRKENEHELETQKSKSDICIKLIQVVNKFKLSLLLHCQTKNEQKDELIRTMSDKFQQIKKDFADYAKEFERLGGVVPNELKSLINETKMNTFNDMNKYKEFSRKIDSLKEQIK